MAQQQTTRQGNGYAVIFALWLLVFSSSSQIIIVSPMLPQIGARLGAPENLQGLLVSVYALTVGLFALVAGPVSDHLGRRAVLLAGAGLMSAALGLHFFADDFARLLAVRALAGVAGGVLTGSAVSYVGDYFPANRRGWANGWVMSSTALGQIASVPIGTLLAARFDFRFPFLLFAVVMAFAFALIYFCVPQPAVERDTEKLTIGASLRSYWQLLHKREALAAAAVYALMFLSIALFVVFLPAWITARFGATPGDIALVFAIGGVANAVTGPFAGKISDRIGRKIVVIAACVGLAILMFATTFVATEFWVLYPLLFATMALVAARMSPLQALLSELTDGKRRGTLLSLTIAIGQLAFAAGGTLAGFVYSRFGYLSSTIEAAVAALLMALLVWQFLPETSRENETSPKEQAPDDDDAALAEIKTAKAI